MQILSPVVGTGVTPTGIRYPRKVQCKRKQGIVYLQRISKVPGMGPGESYTGLPGEVHMTRMAIGQSD